MEETNGVYQYVVKEYGGRFVLEDYDGNQIIGISPIVQSGREMLPEIQSHGTCISKDQY